MRMLLIKDLRDIQKKADYLLTLATKLTHQPYCATTAYDQHLFSSMSKELYRFIKTRMEPDMDREDSNEHRARIRA